MLWSVETSTVSDQVSRVDLENLGEIRVLSEASNYKDFVRLIRIFLSISENEVVSARCLIDRRDKHGSTYYESSHTPK